MAIWCTALCSVFFLSFRPCGHTHGLLLLLVSSWSGQIFTRSELEQIAELCIKHDVLCLSDEVYEWLVYKDSPQHTRIGRYLRWINLCNELFSWEPACYVLFTWMRLVWTQLHEPLPWVVALRVSLSYAFLRGRGIFELNYFTCLLLRICTVILHVLHLFHQRLLLGWESSRYPGFVMNLIFCLVLFSYSSRYARPYLDCGQCWQNFQRHWLEGRCIPKLLLLSHPHHFHAEISLIGSHLPLEDLKICNVLECPVVSWECTGITG